MEAHIDQTVHRSHKSKEPVSGHCRSLETLMKRGTYRNSFPSIRKAFFKAFGIVITQSASEDEEVRVIKDALMATGRISE